MKSLLFYLTIILTSPPTVEQINDLFYTYRAQPLEVVVESSITVPSNIELIRGYNSDHILILDGLVYLEPGFVKIDRQHAIVIDGDNADSVEFKDCYFYDNEAN